MATEHRHVRELRPKLAKHGIDLFSYKRTNGGHLQVFLRKGEHERSMFMPSSSGDCKVNHRLIQKARKLFPDGQESSHP